MKLASVKSVRIPVQAVLGGTTLSLEELASLEEGCIVELDDFVGEPVNLVASGEVIARGEVVIVDEKYGLRLVAMTSGKADD